MSSVHELGAAAALAAAAVLAVGGGLASWRDTAHAPVRMAAFAAAAVFGITALFGIVTLVSGPAPREWLHFVYAAALLGVVPLALVFASEAPPRQRSGVLAVAGLVALLVIWRLYATG